MPDDLQSEALSEVLATTVVDPMFAALPAPWNDPAALPRAVMRNRREQARRRVLDALTTRSAPQVDDELREVLRRMLVRWATREFDGGFTEVEDFEARCELERVLVLALASGDPARVRAAREQVHRERIITEHDRIEIRGLQLSARVSQELEVAYVQLHLDDPTQTETIEIPNPAALREAVAKKPPTTKKPRGKKPAGKKPSASTHDAASLASAMEAVRAIQRIPIVPRRPAPEVVARNPRLLIVGAPGGGKSTLTSWLAVQVARAALGPALDGRVPFVVPVRSLAGERIGPAVIARLHRCDEAFVRELLTAGRAFVVIDGLDEAPGGVRPIADEVRAFLEAWPDTRAVVTSRPASEYSTDGSGDPFVALEGAGFTRTRLHALTRDEVHDFIGRWCLAAERSIQRDRQLAETTARMNADDLRARVRASHAIERLAETPLLCSVLCIVHRFMGNKIPERRVALYEACTNVLLYEWDRAKFAEGSAIGRLDAHQKRFLLAGLAEAMHTRHVAELPVRDVVAHLRAKLPELGVAADDAQALVDEIRDRSGVLVERAPGTYGFSHLLYQEYLTAFAMANRRDVDGLVATCDDPWWHEVIALACGTPANLADDVVGRIVTRAERETSPDVRARLWLLAMSCATSAVSLRAEWREAIDRAAVELQPRTAKTVELLVSAGPIAGAVFLARLPYADPVERCGIAALITRLEYMPGVPAVIDLLSDDTDLNGAEVPVFFGAVVVMDTLIYRVSHSVVASLMSLLPQETSVGDAIASGLDRAGDAVLMTIIINFNAGPIPQSHEFQRLAQRARTLLVKRDPLIDQTPGLKFTLRDARTAAPQLRTRSALRPSAPAPRRSTS